MCFTPGKPVSRRSNENVIAAVLPAPFASMSPDDTVPPLSVAVPNGPKAIVAPLPSRALEASASRAERKFVRAVGSAAPVPTNMVWAAAGAARANVAAASSRAGVRRR